MHELPAVGFLPKGARDSQVERGRLFLAGLPSQRRYLDEPTSATTNDVCIRWNARLVWTAAYLTP